MLLLVLVSRVNRPPSLGADNTVLEATNQRENAEMFFVEHLSQFCQKRHRRTTALHAMQYEFAALQQCNRSPIATLGKRHHQSMKTAYATIKGFEVMRMVKKGQFKLWIEAVGGGTEVSFVNRLFGIYA
jgi:hypothetical protein